MYYTNYTESASCAPSPALRSYAQQNPGAKVWFLVTSPTLDDSDRLVARLRAHYGNLRVVAVDLDRLFAGTPVEQIFTSGNWTRETRECWRERGSGGTSLQLLLLLKRCLCRYCYHNYMTIFFFLDMYVAHKTTHIQMCMYI